MKTFWRISGWVFVLATIVGVLYWYVEPPTDYSWVEDWHYHHNRLKSGPDAEQFIRQEGFDPATQME